MRLYEHEGKKLFGTMGLAVPHQYGVIGSPEELDSLGLEFPVMIKSLVLVGGRGKAGGIKKAHSLEDAREKAAAMLKLTLKGYPVEKLLVEQLASEAGACYVGVTTNPSNFNVILMASAEGGVEIEQVAVEKPEAILREELPGNEKELPQEVATKFARFLNEKFQGGQQLEDNLTQAVSLLFKTFQHYDCKVAEINPLLITTDGEALAADSKMVLDDNALFRQGQVFETLGIREARHDVSEPTRDEVRARDAGFVFVDLLDEDAPKDPEKLYVGLVPGGAGYGIFSIDETANVGDRFFDGKVVPVNFMDSGGGPSVGRVAEMFHLLMDKELVDVIITSRFGGISSCDIFIRGLVKCLVDRHADGRRMIPIHGRMVGTDLPSARAYLQQASVELPEATANMEIVVGNQEIMFDIIKEGVRKGFEFKAQKGGES